MSKIRIVSCDPGFANIGFGALDLDAEGSTLLSTALVRTKPGTGKVKQINDELRRLHEIEDAFLFFLNEWKPDVVAVEEPGKCLMRRQIGKRVAWQTNPTLLRTSCLMWGAISGICRARGIYIVKYGSQEIKKAVCGGNNKASKTEMEKAIRALYPTYTGWAKTKAVEHEVDAVGAGITAFKEPFVMSLIRNLQGRAGA
jgi:Holliday junction resolvasome RuvABC endonuclease subunit